MLTIFENYRYLLFLTLSATSVYAQEGHFYYSLEYGNSYSHLSNSNPSITYNSGFLTDDYPLNTANASTGVGGIKGGYAWSGKGWVPTVALGLGLYGTPNGYHYDGQVKETSLGSSSDTLYDYQLVVNSTRLMAETRLSWDFASHVSPYLDLGVGPAWNRVNQYQETPVTADGYASLPAFQNHTTTNLAYQAGVGIGYRFNFDSSDTSAPREQISMGYRYANLGSISSGTRSDAYPYSLDLGTLSTQDLYLAFSHSF